MRLLPLPNARGRRNDTAYQGDKKGGGQAEGGASRRPLPAPPLPSLIRIRVIANRAAGEGEATSCYPTLAKKPTKLIVNFFDNGVKLFYTCYKGNGKMSIYE